jgi:fructose-1,6-bisphosphatase/inositol monophosphatase family enzyme
MDLREQMQLMGLQLQFLIGRGKRGEETNLEWGQLQKSFVRNHVDRTFRDISTAFSIPIVIVDMPYTAETGSGRGEGKNPVIVDRVFGDAQIGVTENIYCLTDDIDGTWNMSCGFPYSCSTTIALTQPTRTRPEDLTLAHFSQGFIFPYFREGMFYWDHREQPPRLLTWDEGHVLPLHMSPITTPKQTRLIVDLFTELSDEGHIESLATVQPLLHEWCDFGRFYGAGVEISMLFGYRNMQPGFSAYVAACQKMDNIAPTYGMVLGAGGFVTDWWGNSIMGKKLSDRVHVVMSANEPLHTALVQRLSKREKPA